MRLHYLSVSQNFIPLLSVRVGGSELRFADIADALSARGTETHLVVPATLRKQLARVRPALPTNTVVLGEEGDSLANFLRIYALWVRRQRSGSHSFHYPLNCFPAIHAGLPHRVTCSYTDSIPIDQRTRSLQWQIWMRTLFWGAQQLDVLNPSVYRSLHEYFPQQAPKLSVTPSGTFINPDTYTVGTKVTDVVFASRLAPKIKGIEELLHLLPEVSKNLGDILQEQMHFKVLGDGPLRDFVASEIAHLRRESVSVTYMGETDVRPIFSQASVVLSLQTYNNYPSRVVAEGLLSGCFVIVRDTGESRLFGDLPGLIYVGDNLQAGEVASAISSGYKRLRSDPGFSKEIRREAIRRFSCGDVLDYFQAMLCETRLNDGGPSSH